MNQPLDSILVLIFTLVQVRITLLLLRAARRRFTSRWLFAARAAIVVLDAFLALGYSFSFAAVLPHMPLDSRPAMLIGAITVAYLASSSMVLAVHLAMSIARQIFKTDADPGRRRVLNTAGNVLMTAPFAAIAYGALIQRTDFRVREIDVPFPDLPKDLDGLRLLHLSDIHLSAFLSEAELARVIDACRGLSPHAAFVTGDLISSVGDPVDLCIRQLARLKTDAGVFGCLGNHEVAAMAENYTASAAARAGLHFLRGQTAQLRFGSAAVNLAGVDYQSMRHRDQYLKGAERLVQPGSFNILMSHNPDVFPVAARQGYNLMLAGHTHGGQVTVEILEQTINPARFFTPYVYGLYRANGAAAYVTRGIGTIGIPARLGAPPEISLLRLRKV